MIWELQVIPLVLMTSEELSNRYIKFKCNVTCMYVEHKSYSIYTTCREPTLTTQRITYHFTPTCPKGMFLSPPVITVFKLLPVDTKLCICWTLYYLCLY